MSNPERVEIIRPEIVDKAVKDYQSGKSVDVGSLGLSEFDEWLKDTIIKYRYPFMITFATSLGWLAYRSVRRIFNRRQ